MSTITEGRNDIMGFLQTAWTAGAAGAPLYFVGKDDLPPEGGSWGRAKVLHSTRSQATLSNENGIRRWEQHGILFVQLFTLAGTGLSALDTLGQMLIGAFQGKTTNGIWFRNARVSEVGRDGKWESYNFIVEFQYDQLA